MSKSTLIPLLAVLMLTACASGNPPTLAPTLTVPANLTAKCPDLPLLQSGSLNDLLSNHIQVAKAYHECRNHHNDLADWLKKTGTAQ
ncbi:hypothetical protein [uncultured Aquitalea sp.]|uniref:Rz1-like lysis system protein LysC n=1 Tax=uncultured Aquitalea sp. TaxID=540272 RepID=UPI0025E6568F|nr:hypothetical protein [uncultured Aquitalea sp.]